MAIYHLEAKVVSRGIGRSACAAAAYQSCSKIYNDYDGIQHDYTRKEGLVWEQVFLPSTAPPEWQDREKLWNAVEQTEKARDSRLAREFVVALPTEENPPEWRELVSRFVLEQFISDGMCADVAIHDTGGHNPHAHILLTVRPLDEKGQWQYKTKKEYLCVRNGEEKGFTAEEYNAAQHDGWEKQYPYKVGKKKVYLTTSEGEAHGYKRTSKYPKCTKFGRQNSVTQRWNSEEQLDSWRAAWADAVNLSLEQAGQAKRVDHRSNADRGIDEQPTIHEGVASRIMESRGMVSDRMKLNRQIKADNRLLREWKATVQKLTKAIKESILTLAETMESAREHMVVLQYRLFCNQRGSESIQLEEEADRFAEMRSEAAPEHVEELNEICYSLREKSTNRIMAKLLSTFGGSFDRSKLSRASDAVDRRLGEDPETYRKFAERQRRERGNERKGKKVTERER